MMQYYVAEAVTFELMGIWDCRHYISMPFEVTYLLIKHADVDYSVMLE